MRPDILSQGEGNHDRLNVPFQVRTYDSLPSTNQYCELLDLTQTEEFTVICARQQTAGIGQRGNHWASEPGKNLTFSLILKPTFLPPASQYQLTKAVSLGITDHLRTLVPTSADLKIKWPNDIYVNGRKICGILISNKISGVRLAASIIGIGLNANQSQFPEWVPNPIALCQLTQQYVDLDTLLHNLLQAIALRYAQLTTAPDILDREYLAQLLYLGQEHLFYYHDRPILATIQGVNTFGHLQLTTADGEALTCQLKEIAFATSAQ